MALIGNPLHPLHFIAPFRHHKKNPNALALPADSVCGLGVQPWSAWQTTNLLFRESSLCV